jgi:hypothetical protein
LHNKEPYPNRGETDAKDPHAEKGNFQKTREVSPMKEATRWAQASRLSPFLGPFVAPFDLDDPLAIYSPPFKSHASINSSFATEEQRREGHHSGEERVELVV